MPLAGKEEDPALAPELAVLPYRARRAALAAGLEPVLSRILHERAEAGGPSMLLLAEEQELGLRLAAFDAQLTAAGYEAACTARSLQGLLAELGGEEQTRQFSLTVTSIVVAGVLGTASGVWALADASSHAPDVVGIAGSLTLTGLGVASLLHVERTVTLHHPRNRLTPIWRGVDPDHLYPTFVFRMLTSPDPALGQTPRDELLAAWREQLARALPTWRENDADQLLFGDGGIYSDAALALRAGMFDAIGSAIQGIARDMELLNRSLVRALTTPGAGLNRIPATSQRLNASR
jgi:hypothetical protein